MEHFALAPVSMEEKRSGNKSPGTVCNTRSRAMIELCEEKKKMIKVQNLMDALSRDARTKSKIHFAPGALASLFLLLLLLLLQHSHAGV